MAITITGGAGLQGTNSVNANSTITKTGCTAGNSLAILLRWDGTVSVSSITCSGETVEAIGTENTNYTHAGNPHSRFYEIKNLQSSSDKVVNVTLSGSPASVNCLAVWELSGADTTGTYDNEVKSSGSGVPSTSLTTGSANAAIIAYCSGNSGQPGAGTGYTALGGANIIYYDNCEHDEDVGAAGSKTVAFTVSQGNYGIHAISFKAAGAGGGGGKPVNYYWNMA